MIPDPIRIYHITSISNLPSIISSGGLYSTHALKKRGVLTDSIAYPDIQSRRDVFSVSCGSGGTIHDYVPWMFAPRSPMLYAISHGNVPSVTGQNNIIHLVSTVDRVVEAGCPFVFTDGHATVFASKFYNDFADLDKVDWEVMKLKVWKDTQQARDRKRKRQAEFLVHDWFPWELIAGIAVIDEYRLNLVRGIVRQTTLQPQIKVKRNWYY